MFFFFTLVAFYVGDTLKNCRKKIKSLNEYDYIFFSVQVSALGLDPSGARLITGGYDYDVKFWDFAGMDASLQAFRSLQPCEWWA